MIALPNVTLTMLVTRDHKPAAAAIAWTLKHCRPRNILMFTDNPSEFKGFPNVSFYPVRPFEKHSDMCVWALTLMPYLLPALDIGTHLLGIHWDGYVVNPGAWTDEFLDYDYIGAPWNNNLVGNGGFSLTSRNFWDAVGDLQIRPLVELCHPSDVWLCRDDLYKKRLTDAGMRYASPQLARRFSVENEEYNGSFGFHGRYVYESIKKQGKIEIPPTMER